MANKRLTLLLSCAGTYQESCSSVLLGHGPQGSHAVKLTEIHFNC